MAGTIELPTLVQKIRVDTKSMNRAEKAAGKFGDRMDEATDSVDDYSESTRDADVHTRRLNDSMDDLRETVHDTRGETVGFDDDIDRTRRSTRGLGDDTDDTTRRVGLLGKGFKGAGVAGGLFGQVMGNIKFQAIASLITVAAGAISALTAGAIAFIGQVSPIVGILGSIPAALGALLSTKLVFSSLIKGPVDAAKAIQKYGAASKEAKEALKGLTPEGRKFTLELVKTQNAFKKARDAAGVEAFPGLSKGLEGLRTLMPIITKGMKGIGGVIGSTASALGDLAKSGPFRKDFGTIVEANTTLVRTLGAAVVPLVKTLINITKAAGPMTQAFADAFLRASTFLESITGSESGQKRLTKFFEHTTTVVFQLGRIFRDLGVGLFNLFSIGAKHSTDFLGNLERLSKKFRDFTSSTEGKGKLAKFFEDAKPVLHETGLLFKDLFSAFGQLSGDSDVAALISQVRTQLLPAFVDFADVVNKNIAPILVNLATAFINFQNVLTFSPIATVANALASLINGITGLITKVPGLATFVATLLSFNLAVKGMALAGKVTGVTKLAEGLTSLGAAGATGQKGIAGFIQGLRGADKSKGKLTAANLFGKAIRGAGGLGKKAGSAFLTGVSSVASAAKSGAQGFGRIFSGAVTAATGAGKAAGRGFLSGLSVLKGGAVSALSGMSKLLGVVATGFRVAAGAARGFALALLANPVVLIIAGIIALVAALIYAYKHSEKFRNIVNAAFSAVKTVVMTVLNFLKGFIQAAWNTYKAIFGGVLKVIWTIVRTYFTIYKTVITTAFKVIKAVVTGAWSFIKGIFGGAVKFIARLISTYVALWKAAFSKGLDLVKALFRTVFIRIPEIVREKLGGLLKWLGGLGGRILDKLGDFGSLLYAAGRALIEGLWRGIKAVASLPVDAVKGILGGIRNLLPGSPVKKGPLRVLNRGYAGGQISRMLADGIDRQRHVVAKSARGLAAAAAVGSALEGVPAVRTAGSPAIRGTGQTQITYDQRKTYDVDVHETTGPSSIDSITRRLATIALLGPSSIAQGAVLSG